MLKNVLADRVLGGVSSWARILDSQTLNLLLNHYEQVTCSSDLPSPHYMMEALVKAKNQHAFSLKGQIWEEPRGSSHEGHLDCTTGCFVVAGDL